LKKYRLLREWILWSPRTPKKTNYRDFYANIYKNYQAVLPRLSMPRFYFNFTLSNLRHNIFDGFSACQTSYFLLELVKAILEKVYGRKKDYF